MAKNNKSKEPVKSNQLIANLIKIRYSHFENPLFKYIIVALYQHIGHHTIRATAYHDHSTKNKGVFNWSKNLNASKYKGDLKFLFSFYRVMNIFKQHYNNFNEQKSQLLMKYGKFDKEHNKHVLYEPESISKFNEEYNKLLNIIVQLEIIKFSPRTVFNDIFYLYDQSITHFFRIWLDEIIPNRENYTDSVGTINRLPPINDPFVASIFNDVMDDIFDIDDLLLWKVDIHQEEYNKTFET